MICPSNDAAARISRYFPSARVQIVPHEEIGIPMRQSCSSRPRLTRRIAILGAFGAHKGLNLINSTVEFVSQRKLPLAFYLIGYSGHQSCHKGIYSETGPYDESDLPELIDSLDPDVILFPAQCPETYCYALSMAIKTGRPIIVTDIGALPERVINLQQAHIIPWNIKGAELADFLLKVPLNHYSKETESITITKSGRSRFEADEIGENHLTVPRINKFYGAEYLSPLSIGTLLP